MTTTDWTTPKTTSYRCHIAFLPEADGSCSAIVLNLPGAGSCGDTEREATAHVREAITGVIESYKADGEEIPWLCPSEEAPEDASHTRWIIVNV